MESCSTATFRCAVVETQGRRPSHEDAHAISCAEHTAHFWVLDGHKGFEAAHFGATALPKEIGGSIKCGKLPSNGQIKQGFRTVDNQLRKHLREKPEESRCGSTVVGALVARQGNGTYSAKLINCGDSRGIIIKNPSEEGGNKSVTVLETVDHKPGSPVERARVEGAGGKVCGVRVPRIDGRLAVSRGLGDFDFKADRTRQASEQKVSNQPDIYEISDLGPGALLLLACDGVWSVLSSDVAAAEVRRRLRREPSADLGEVAASIARMSLDRGSSDNVTVLLVHLGGAAPVVASQKAPAAGAPEAPPAPPPTPVSCGQPLRGPTSLGGS